MLRGFSPRRRTRHCFTLTRCYFALDLCSVLHPALSWNLSFSRNFWGKRFG
ncbi:hypothetical protein HBH72_061740 [Parastagonospora nodorum]|nr:hypothetical protein HBH72_061740 [Parastagonospora nodorum]